MTHIFMALPINQFKTIEEKLRIYNKPFIEISLLQKILDKFAPNYEIKELSRRWLLAPIVRGKLYLNLLSSKKKWLLATTILAQYGKNKLYTIGGIYLYNQYHFSQQVANKITVYNTSIRGERTIAGYTFMFRQVRPSFFRGIEKVDAQWYGTYYGMTRERALIQLIEENDGKLEYAQDIYQEIKKKNISTTKLITLSQKHTSKRVQLLVKKFLEIWQHS